MLDGETPLIIQEIRWAPRNIDRKRKGLSKDFALQDKIDHDAPSHNPRGQNNLDDGCISGR